MIWPLVIVAGLLFAIDSALRPWKGRAGENAIYLAIAYVPMVTLPLMTPPLVALVAGLVAVLSMWSFCRMVGLTEDIRFFRPALIATALCHVAAYSNWYGLFQATPAFAILLVVVTSAFRSDPKAILQKICLAWLSVLVWGYLFGHAVVLSQAKLAPLARGQVWLAVIVVLAKCADLAWVAVQRVRPKSDWLELVASPIGGAVGGATLGLWLQTGMSRTWAFALGVFVAIALAFASRAYNLIVEDVIGAQAKRPLKGAMVFGFAFALAVGFHLIRYLAP